MAGVVQAFSARISMSPATCLDLWLGHFFGSSVLTLSQQLGHVNALERSMSRCSRLLSQLVGSRSCLINPDSSFGIPDPLVIRMLLAMPLLNVHVVCLVIGMSHLCPVTRRMPDSGQFYSTCFVSIKNM